MSAIIETVEVFGKIFSGAITPVLLAWLGFKFKFRFDKSDRKLEELEIINKEEHSTIRKSIEYVTARDSLSHSLAKVCNSSIAYTKGDNVLNSFKTLFTNSIIKLGTSTLRTGFDKGELTKDIFRGYMVVGGAEIKSSYKVFDPVFTELMKNHIQEASEIYYKGILDLIDDKVFNDKGDRFVIATITFLRSELMIITKHWWTHISMKNNIDQKEHKKTNC